MAIYTYLDASTAHITEQDSYALTDISRRSWPMTVAQYMEGFIVPVPPRFFYKYETTWRDVGLSDSFIALMRHAQEQKAAMVMLDADGDIVDSLEQHDWNTRLCQSRKIVDETLDDLIKALKEPK